MSDKDREVEYIVVFLIGISFIILGIAGFIFSYLPFDFFMSVVKKSYIGVVSFNEKTFPFFIIRLRFVSVIFGLLAAVLFFTKKNFIDYLKILPGSLKSLMKDSMSKLKRAFIAEDKIHLYSLWGITLLGVMVRFYYLFQPMRYDEAHTYVAFASKPLYFAISRYNFNNHLLNTFLIFITSRLLGSQAWAIRLPAFLAGIFIIPAAYFVARIFYDRETGLLTAALVASSIPLILYSVNARGYTLITLFFLLFLVVAHQLKQTDTPALWFFFVIFASLGFYTIPTMLYPFGIVFTWLLLSTFIKDIKAERIVFIKRLFVYSAVALVLVILLYSPVIVVTGWQPERVGRWVKPLQYDLFLSLLLSNINELRGQWTREIPLLFQFLLVVGLVTSVLFHRRIKSEGFFILGCAVLFLTPTILLQRRFTHIRIWLFMLPLFFCIATGGLVYLVKILLPKIKRYSGYLFPALAIISSLWVSFHVIHGNHLLYDRAKEIPFDIRVATFLRDKLGVGDGLVVRVPTYYPLRYYFRENGISDEIFISYVTGDFNSKKRLYVVLNHVNNHRMQELLQLKNIDRVCFTEPILLVRYDYDSIYQLDRITLESENKTP